MQRGGTFYPRNTELYHRCHKVSLFYDIVASHLHVRQLVDLDDSTF